MDVDHTTLLCLGTPWWMTFHVLSPNRRTTLLSFSQRSNPRCVDSSSSWTCLLPRRGSRSTSPRAHLCPSMLIPSALCCSLGSWARGMKHSPYLLGLPLSNVKLPACVLDELAIHVERCILSWCVQLLTGGGCFTSTNANVSMKSVYAMSLSAIRLPMSTIKRNDKPHRRML